MIELEHAVLSDFLFTVLLFAGTSLLAAGVASNPLAVRALLGAGVLLGLATITKPAGQPLVILAPVVVWLLTRAWRPTLRATLASAAGVALVVTPVIVRNGVNQGHPVVSAITEPTLFWRAFDGPNPQPFVGSDPDTNMVRKLYDKAAADKLPTPGPWVTAGQFMAKGDMTFAAFRKERRIAVRGFLANPVNYIKTSTAYLLTFAQYASPRSTVVSSDLSARFAASQNSAPSLIRRPVGSISWRMMNRVGLFITIWWWILSFCGLAGALLLWRSTYPKKAATATFAFAWLIVAVTTAMMGIPDLRYSLAGMPLMWVFGSAGAITVVKALYAFLTSTSRGRARA